MTDQQQIKYFQSDPPPSSPTPLYKMAFVNMDSAGKSIRFLSITENSIVRWNCIRYWNLPSSSLNALMYMAFADMDSAAISERFHSIAENSIDRWNWIPTLPKLTLFNAISLRKNVINNTLFSVPFITKGCSFTITTLEYIKQFPLQIQIRKEQRFSIRAEFKIKLSKFTYLFQTLSLI